MYSVGVRKLIEKYEARQWPNPSFPVAVLQFEIFLMLLLPWNRNCCLVQCVEWQLSVLSSLAWDISTDAPEKLESISLGTYERKSVSSKIACCSIFLGGARSHDGKPVSVNY